MSTWKEDINTQLSDNLNSGPNAEAIKKIISQKVNQTSATPFTSDQITNLSFLMDEAELVNFKYSSERSIMPDCRASLCFRWRFLVRFFVQMSASFLSEGM